MLPLALAGRPSLLRLPFVSAMSWYSTWKGCSAPSRASSAASVPCSTAQHACCAELSSYNAAVPFLACAGSDRTLDTPCKSPIHTATTPEHVVDSSVLTKMRMCPKGQG